MSSSKCVFPGYLSCNSEGFIKITGDFVYLLDHEFQIVVEVGLKICTGEERTSESYDNSPAEDKYDSKNGVVRGSAENLLALVVEHLVPFGCHVEIRPSVPAHFEFVHAVHQGGQGYSFEVRVGWVCLLSWVR